jgi:hypothetical protein
VKSKANRQFWKLFEKLPKRVQLEAKSLYRIWLHNPGHPSLRFKKIAVSHGLPVYSIRVGLRWRALGILDDDILKWFWIGSHEAYNEIIKQL